jgi:transketolase
MSAQNTSVILDGAEMKAVRAEFGASFEQMAKEDERVVAVTADLGGSVSLGNFASTNPDRYFNCGVAEQNMIGICAGMAMQGYVPFAITFGAFLGRAVDHIRQSIGHNRLKVNVVGSHGGISNGKDGPSAHAIEDLAIFRAMPTFAVVVVSDSNQLAPALKASVEHDGPVYLRLYREPTPVFYGENPDFTIGKANVLREGTDVTIVACGPHVGFCLKWAEAWQDEVSVEVIDCHTLAPFDDETVLASAAKTRAVVTVEDHLVVGGLGSAVAEVLGENLPTKMKRVGLRGYATSGSYYELVDHVGLGAEAVRHAVDSVREQ